MLSTWRKTEPLASIALQVMYERGDLTDKQIGHALGGCKSTGRRKRVGESDMTVTEFNRGLRKLPRPAADMLLAEVMANTPYTYERNEDAQDESRLDFDHDGDVDLGDCMAASIEAIDRDGLLQLQRMCAAGDVDKYQAAQAIANISQQMQLLRDARTILQMVVNR